MTAPDALSGPTDCDCPTVGHDRTWTHGRSQSVGRSKGEKRRGEESARKLQLEFFLPSLDRARSNTMAPLCSPGWTTDRPTDRRDARGRLSELALSAF